MKTAGLAGNSVKVTKIIEDDISDLRKVYDPTHRMQMRRICILSQ